MMLVISVPVLIKKLHNIKIKERYETITNPS